MPSWLATGSRLRALLRTPGMMQVVAIAVLVIAAEVVAVGIITGTFSSHGGAGPAHAGPRLAWLTEANSHAAPRHAAGAAVVTRSHHAAPAPAVRPAAQPASAPASTPAPPATPTPLRHVSHSQPKRRSHTPQAPSQPAPQPVSQPAPSAHRFRHQHDHQAPAPNADPSPDSGQWHHHDGGQHEGDDGGSGRGS
jgi:hypothetical protein